MNEDLELAYKDDEDQIWNVRYRGLLIRLFLWTDKGVLRQFIAELDTKTLTDLPDFHVRKRQNGKLLVALYGKKQFVPNGDWLPMMRAASWDCLTDPELDLNNPVASAVARIEQAVDAWLDKPTVKKKEEVVA